MALTRTGANVPKDFGEAVVNRLSTMKRVNKLSIVTCVIVNRKSVRKLLLLGLVLCFSIVSNTLHLVCFKFICSYVCHSTLHELGVSRFPQQSASRWMNQWMDINGVWVTRESKDVHWAVKMEWHFPVALLSNTSVDLIQVGNGTEKSSRLFLNAFVSI